MVVFNFLPAIVESQITKRITKDLKIQNFQIKINKLGFFNTNAGGIKTKESLEIDSIDIDYSPLALIRKKIKKISISGMTLKADLDKNFQLNFDDFNINKPDKKSETSADFDFTNLSLIPEKFEIKNSKIVLQTGSDQLSIPFEISSGAKYGNDKFSATVRLMIYGETLDILADVDLNQGIPNITLESQSLDLNNLSQIIKTFIPEVKIPQDTKVGIKTDISLIHKKLDVQGQLVVATPYYSPLVINYTSQVNIDNPESFTIIAENKPIDTLKINHNNQVIFLKNPHFSIRLKKPSQNIEGNFVLKTDYITTISNDTNIHAETIKLESNFNYTVKSPGKKLKIFSKADIKKIIVKSSEHTAVITGVSIKMPLIFPFNLKSSSGGTFKVSQCVFDKTYALKMGGNISQEKSGLLLDGGVASPDIKDFKLGFNVKGVRSGSGDIIIESGFKSNPFHLASANLKKFIPKNLEGIGFAFNLSLNGNISYSSRKIQSNLNLILSNGNINIPDSKLSLKGISTNLKFKDLLTFQSLPAQSLTVDSIKLNEISMENAKIKYNIESLESLFIESSIVKWCKGTVSSEALRLPEKDNNYAITLYCDRLELTDILEQIGAFHAEGNGTMSGRIPVTYADGEIAFDNGFLFSTPGKGGKIIIDQADKLTQGIPLDTPQFSQLDLAKEALKNYDYKWAKLNFNTFEDTLLVNMKFDGSPSNKVLPFEYKKELGRFVRVDATNPGSHFQGIKLDVNLKLPFNQVMEFGNNLKKVF